jgi:hypothetical protein
VEPSSFVRERFKKGFLLLFSSYLDFCLFFSSSCHFRFQPSNSMGRALFSCVGASFYATLLGSQWHLAL